MTVVQETHIQAPLGKLKAPMPDDRPWQVLGSLLPFNSPDHKLWWEKFGSITQDHLEGTNYSVGAQYRYLLMLHSMILPVLGPLPNKARTNLKWPFFLNNNDPCEISVNYQGNSEPCVRLAIDPSGPMAGTKQDPMNDHVPRRLLENLTSMQSDIDFQLFDHFNDNMVLSNKMARNHWESVKEHEIKSQRILAFDLQDDSFTVKTYCVPLIRSLTTGVDPLSLTFDSIKAICSDSTVLSALSMVDNYLAGPESLALDFNTYMSFDLKELVDSRFKIYVAAKVKSSEEAYDFWTLGGRLKGEEIERGFELVQRIWDIVWESPLPSGKPREYIPIHWNWEFSPKSPYPVPKAYFQLWDEYDGVVPEAVTSLFEHLGWTEYLATHRKIENASYSAFDLNKTVEVYTWVSIAFSNKKGPYVTVYSNPAACL
ncbi:aromatic prenyltransferase [Penicillium angulare]|uniref:Aromatic prenyltransferase n=1 Tax=Penicillium angulare TaxID=116970 RepID=A0A9W9KQD4_9EURO|nr:aromatic prenyltransferase [Penicillium angulare]